MNTNKIIVAGSALTINKGGHLIVEKIILLPTTPGTSMTLVQSPVGNNGLPPTVTVREAITLWGPFFFAADSADMTLTAATGNVVLVGAQMKASSTLLG